MERRRLLERACAVLAAGCGAASFARAAADPVPRLHTLAVLDVELIDEQDNPLTRAAQEARLRNATRQLQQELRERRLYDVLDNAPAQALQQRLRAQQEYLFQCEDCCDQIGRLLGAELVMASWVQKVSELILNLNVQVYSVGARRIVLGKSVDMRGNADLSWTRAVSYLVREMAQRREREPAYGL
jgi:hypothetical protein